MSSRGSANLPTDSEDSSSSCDEEEPSQVREVVEAKSDGSESIGSGDDEDDDDDDDEEEEEEEDDDNMSDADAADDFDPFADSDSDTEEPKISKSSIAIINAKYAMVLVENAVDAEWEARELADLLVLVKKASKLSRYAVFRLIMKTDCCSADLLILLQDRKIGLPAHLNLRLLRHSFKDVMTFLASFSDVLETGLFPVRGSQSTEMIDLLYQEANEVMTLDEKQMLRFCTILCSHSETFKQTGKIVNVFSQNLLSREKAFFAYDVSQREFFLDMKGDVKDFYKQLDKGVGDQVQRMHSEQGGIKAPDSDEDDNGNLKGFIENSDEDDSEDDNGDYDDGDDDEEDEDGDDGNGDNGGEIKRVVKDDDDDDDDGDNDDEEEDDDATQSSDGRSSGVVVSGKRKVEPYSHFARGGPEEQAKKKSKKTRVIEDSESQSD